MSSPDSRQICCWAVGDRPVMAYAAASVEKRLSAVNLFPCTTWKRSWWARAVRMAVRCGMDARWSSLQDSVDPLLPTSDQTELLSAVKSMTGGVDPVWLVTWPAQPERQRIYLILRLADASSICVIKIGAGSFNARQLRNEAAVLKRLADTPLPFSIPSVLFERTLPGNRTAVALTGFPQVFRPVNARHAVSASVAMMDRLRQVQVPSAVQRLGDCDWMSLFQAKAPECPAAQNLLENQEMSVEMGMAHGDLGPGNMLRDDAGHVLLFDWENASMQAPVWTDEIGLWTACRQKRVLRSPALMADALRRQWPEVPDEQILLALAFLCAQENLAANRLLEAWS